MNNRPIYDISFHNSFDYISEVIDALNISDRRICIISDSNVEKYHMDTVRNALAPLCNKVYSFSFAAGEKQKNTHTIEDMYSYIIENHFDRNDVIFALGGGVVGDMSGFLAATYLRGIKFVQLPTSLLAMVDSSIGGKTGVDFNGYKNMVGAFHMPSYVYINMDVLNTLPDREYISGFAEIIKHSIIKDKEYFNYLICNSDKALDRNLSIMAEIIYRSCQIKQSVVEEDPTEKGIRAHLNFGHTIGHAIEKYMNFSMLHGECVALGSIAALYISLKRNLITEEEYIAAVELFKAYRLPVNLNGINDSDIDKIIAITKNDKKADNNCIKFVLVNGIGNAFTDKTVTDEEMKEALKMITGGQNE